LAQAQAPTRPTGNGADSGALVQLFRPVSKADLAAVKTQRGSKAQDILDKFIDANIYAAEMNKGAIINRDGETLHGNSLASRLNAHARQHVIPVQARATKDKVFLVRLDRDEDGTEVANWREQLAPRRSGRPRKDAAQAG